MNLVIWLQIPAAGGGVRLLNPSIKILNRLYGNVNVLGAIIDPPVSVNIKGVKTIAKQDLKNLDYDLILVAGNDASLVPIIQQADELEIDIDKTVLDRTVCMPLFNMKKYNRLRNSHLSILSMNCFGGIICQRLGIPCLSPTKNMYASDSDFIKFLQNPMQSVNDLRFVRTDYNNEFGLDAPIFMAGECEWIMNHYNDTEFARQKWVERSSKINWFNLMVIMYTDKPEILVEFDKLPYAKKVCYVPFESDIESAYNVKLADHPGMALWQIVTDSAKGFILHYDLWDMLLYGKKTPLSISR